MNERIKELRKALGLSQDEFGRRLGLTRGAITNIELNKTEPKPLLIDLICREYNVNEEWIRNGSGDMFVPLTKDEQISTFIGDALRDETPTFKRRLISTLAKLSEDEWKELETVLTRIMKEKDD